MITVSLNTLVNAAPVLRTLSETVMNGKTAFQFARLLREVDRELRTWNDARQKVFLKYGKIENQEAIIQPEYVEQFNKEIEELLQTKIELAVEKIQQEQLYNLQLSPAQIFTIDEFIK